MRTVASASLVMISALLFADHSAIAAGCTVRLFGSENDNFNTVEIDPATGIAAIIGPFDMGQVVSSALAFDSSGVAGSRFGLEPGDELRKPT